MPDLMQSLRGRDLGHLRIIAERWGLELDAPDTRTGLQRLVPQLLNAELVGEIVATLPAEPRAALEDLIRQGGQIPWAQFTLRHGAIREMGAGRRDRERPDRDPQSPAEWLWYRALIARAFFDTPDGATEFAFIPEDVMEILPPARVAAPDHPEPLGRPASPVERAHPLLATDQILDHATTLLAALRLALPLPNEVPELKTLLTLHGLLSPDGTPLPEPTRAFLEAPRGDALARLVQTWLNSPDFDELRQLPGLQAEGDWKNDPLRTRRVLLKFLQHIPKRTWWSLNAFIAAIKQHHPDFQRPAGEYDSWYLKDAESGEFLRGFEHWDQVDGALIRYLITGPMHRLGLIDLATPDKEGVPTAFRWSGWAEALLNAAPPNLGEETGRVFVRSDGRVVVPRAVSRTVRYQIARFCHWDEPKGDEFCYRLTPSSLARAREQGLRVGHLITLMAKHSDGIPPNVTKALKEWETQGAEARVAQVSVLRVSAPELLQALRASKAKRYLGDPLGPTTTIVKPGAEEKVLAALVEMGYLGEVVG
ncbi:MAG: hypothetical protein Fur0022_37180 [Anaerolineales bacterium]